MHNRQAQHFIADLVVPTTKLDVGLSSLGGAGKIVGTAGKAIAIAATALPKASKAANTSSALVKSQKALSVHPTATKNTIKQAPTRTTAPKKFDLNNNNHTNPAPNPTPKPAEKKTPNFMKPTGASSARAVEKKPVNQMTNQEFVQEIANRAERKIGGSGAVSGTKKHSYAKKLGKNAQDKLGERELEFEISYINNKQRGPTDPLKGSTRLDVYDKKNEVVYDYKFVQNPGKGLKQKQIDKIKQQGPKPIKEVIEINPKKE